MPNKATDTRLVDKSGLAELALEFKMAPLGVTKYEACSPN